MKTRKIGIGGVLVGLGALATGVAAAWQGVPPPLAPKVWVHEGDTDGDGLTDAFEAAHGLDPGKVASFADGTPDESRPTSDGRTMWEVQKAEQETAAAAAGGDGGSGGACGLFGVEALILLGLLGVAKKRRR